MEVFELREKLVRDYAAYTTSFVQISDQRIKAQSSGNVFDKDQWGEMVAFMTDSMVCLESAFKDQIKNLAKKLKSMPSENTDTVEQ